MSLPRRRALAALAAIAGAPLLGCESGSPAGRARREPALPKSRALRRIRSIAVGEGRGATVQRIFPTPELGYLDPFVLLDDFTVAHPAGFPDHPHRGFEAFTYMLGGAFHHKDNLGHDSVIGAGGTQRFTSGRGARHSEMPVGDGNNHGLQLWVNLPRRLKRIEPSYAGTPPEAVPLSEGGGARVRRVVGAGSPVSLRTDVKYVDIALDAGKTYVDQLSDGYTSILYVLDGKLRAAGERLAPREGILPSGGLLEVAAESAARFVLLSGRPHGEPILHRGPFVD